MLLYIEMEERFFIFACLFMPFLILKKINSQCSA